jgi:aminoglycoside phosphotransferase (APT) family kinase protein
MSRAAERIVKALSLRRLIPARAAVSKLRRQGLSGEVYRIDPNGKDLILKIYRAADSDKTLREAELYRRLSDLGVPVPKVHYFDADGRLGGRPFLLIERLEGERFSSLLRRGRGGDFVESLAESLHKLHSIRHDGLSLSLERRTFQDEVRELKLVSAILLGFSTGLLVLRRVYRALSGISGMPVTGDFQALLHGDCSPDNGIYRDGVVYLIDFESSYVGDPAFDVGYAYHCIRLAAPDDPGLPERFVRAYENLHGKLENLEAYLGLSALKLAVFLRFLGSVNPLSIVMVGLRRSVEFLGFRRELSTFVQYCLEYAEKIQA